MTDILTTLGDWLFKGWESIGRVLVVGTLAYAGLLLFLRISGKRTLSKMNAFDLVITVALGSTLSTIVMSRQTGLADGLAGLATLIGLQFLVARLSVGWLGFRRLIKSEPSLLFYQGQFVRQTMQEQRVVEGEVLAAIRQAGISRLADVRAVVLEANGVFTVVKTSTSSGSSSLDQITR